MVCCCVVCCGVLWCAVLWCAVVCYAAATRASSSPHTLHTCRTHPVLTSCIFSSPPCLPACLQTELGESTAALFTRDGEQANNLFEMQAVWYEVSSGRAYLKQQQYGKVGRGGGTAVGMALRCTEAQQSALCPPFHQGYPHSPAVLRTRSPALIPTRPTLSPSCVLCCPAHVPLSLPRRP